MPLVAGNDVEGYCPKCKKDQEHTALKVHSGVVHSVRCKKCTAEHPYQRPHSPAKPKKKKKAATTTRRRTKKSKVPERTPWEELLAGRDASEAVPYAISARFGAEDLVTHAKFGIGMVTEVLQDDKIEVVFQDGYKKLVHGRT